MGRGTAPDGRMAQLLSFVPPVAQPKIGHPAHLAPRPNLAPGQACLIRAKVPPKKKQKVCTNYVGFPRKPSKPIG